MFSFPPSTPILLWPILAQGVTFLLVIGVISGLLLRPKRKSRWYDSWIWLLAGYMMSTVFVTVANRSPGTEYLGSRFLAVGWALIITGILVSAFRLRRLGQYDEMLIGISSLILVVLSTELIRPSVTGAREAARRSQCKNNLKQLGLAMQHYYDEHQSYPPQIAGDPPRSWRVEMLPYLDKQLQAATYEENERWNSEINLPLARHMNLAFECPTAPVLDPDALKITSYVIPIGDRAIYAAGRPPRKQQEIPDGLSHTALQVEAIGQGIVWTEPRDVDMATSTMAVNSPGAKWGQSKGVLSSYHVGGAHVVLADGSARFISQDISSDTLLKLLQADDGPPGEF